MKQVILAPMLTAAPSFGEDVRDARTGAQIRGQALDIRGNTDDSWQRGARYILRNNVFRSPPP